MTLSLSTVRVAQRSAPRTSLTAIIATSFTVWKQRRALAALAPHQLKDMGISRQNAALEAARPLWDLPRQTRC